MKKIGVLLLVLYVLTSCDSSIVYSEYSSIDKGWDKNNSIEFQYQTSDTIQTKDVFIMLRNDEKYPYSNIFLITKMQMPNKKVVIDTLEYEMANPDGSWKGYGLGSNKESKLWYKENVKFPVPGTYTFSITQAMRNIGSVEGIGQLEGINEVGLQIENSSQQ